MPEGRNPDPDAFRAYAAELQPEAAAYGLTLESEPVTDDDHWDAKLKLLIEHPVPLVSMTFGIPRPAEIAALQEAGSRVLISVTTPGEAQAARDAGADGLAVQGSRAGGHSAAHDPFRTPRPKETDELVREVLDAVDLPVIGAGGVDGPEAVLRILEAGAEAVAVGTLLLRTDEAGTSAAHRAALADPRREETVLTRAFTGRPARALRNGFIDRHQDSAPTAYPALHHLTKPLRAAAGQAGDSERLHLWAGTGYRQAPEGPVARVIDGLAAGASAGQDWSVRRFSRSRRSAR
ncbi:NAD(P)H-dependent flavin oxidoreductase [Nesterenkonia populi]